MSPALPCLWPFTTPRCLQISGDLVALPFGRCTSASALSTLHALKTPCTNVCRGPMPSPCAASIGHGASMRQPFQPPLRYSPDAGNYCGVRNALTTDPLLSAEYVAYGGAGAAGLWLHPDTSKLLAAVVAGDKAALAAATAMSQMLSARGTVREQRVWAGVWGRGCSDVTTSTLGAISPRCRHVDVSSVYRRPIIACGCGACCHSGEFLRRLRILPCFACLTSTLTRASQECDAARRALRDGRLACDAANLAAETSLSGAKRKFSEPVSRYGAS